MREQLKTLVLSGAVMFALIAMLGVSTTSAKPLEGAALGVSKASAVMFNPKEYTTLTPTLTAKREPTGGERHKPHLAIPQVDTTNS